jgi:ribosomal protein S6--L-glutamate ligase
MNDKKRICIIGSKEKKAQDLWLIEEAGKRFSKVTYAKIPDIRIYNGEVYLKNVKLSGYDCVFPRVPRTYRSFGYLIAKLLEGKVYMPIVPESILIAHDKFLTLMRLQEHGIPTTTSYFGSSVESMKHVLEEIEYPVVIKLVQGSLGKGVMFAESKSSAVPLLDTIEGMKQPIMIEEFVENPGEDIRALVVGNRVIASMKRKANKDEKRANIGSGGTAVKVKLTEKQEDIAIRTARALGLGIAGVDIIDSKQGPLIIEANVNVHFEGIAEITDVNLAGAMMDYALEGTKKFEKEGATAQFSKFVKGLSWKK